MADSNKLFDISIPNLLKRRREKKELEASRPGRIAIFSRIAPELGLAEDDIAFFLKPEQIDQFTAEDLLDLTSSVAKRKESAGTGGIFIDESGRLVSRPPSGGASKAGPTIDVKGRIGTGEAPEMPTGIDEIPPAITLGPQLEDVTFKTSTGTGKLPKGGTQIQRELDEKAQQALITDVTQKSVDRLFKGQEQKTNFLKVTSLFKRLIAQVKGAGEEQGGLGLAPGLKGAFGAFTKQDKFGRTSALPGQITETTLALNSILTGQNRVIEGVANRIAGTLASRFDPGTFVASKTEQSIRNAFGIIRAFEKAGLTPNKLSNLPSKKIKIGDKEVQAINFKDSGIDIDKILTDITLSDEEAEFLDLLVKDILDTPATEAIELPGFESKQPSVPGSPAEAIQGIDDELLAIQEQLRQLGGK